MDSIDLDIKSLCRLCAKTYLHSVNVLSKCESQSTSSLSNLIQEFFSVIIQAHDGLPSRICIPCKTQLETWDRIRNGVAEAQEYLTQCMLEQTGIHQQEIVTQATTLEESTTIIHTPTRTSLEPPELEWNVTMTERPNVSDSVPNLIPVLEHWISNEPHRESVEKIKFDKKEKGEDNLTCKICSKKFARKDNLRQHLIIHSGQKSFKCDKCPQSFSRSSDLKVHYRIHTSEKPLQCHYCSQLFRESSNFRKHLRTHSGDRPFKCNICNKHFAQSPHLKRHLRIHSGERPYRCEICNRQFSQSSTLRTHERTHSGLKPHNCNICSRSFRHASTLKAHARTHTGEKAFYCDKCPKSFYWRTSFDCHVLTHSPVNK